MESLPDKVMLADNIQNCECIAHIRKLTRELAKREIDAKWWQIGGSKSARKAEGDHSWNWTDTFGEFRLSKWAELVAVQTADGEIQGAMGYWLDGSSLIEPGQGAVFINYLATAPRNRPWLVAPAKYAGVGTALVFYAVCHSYLLGLGGRVILVSLPTETTRQFYQNRSFTKISEDEQGNIEYELTPPDAQRWLVERGVMS